MVSVVVMPSATKLLGTEVRVVVRVGGAKVAITGGIAVASSVTRWRDVWGGNGGFDVRVIG